MILKIHLKKLRKAQNLSQKEVSRILGYTSGQFVCNWEHGLALPPVGKLKKLAKLYKTDFQKMAKSYRLESHKNLDLWLNKKLGK